MRPTTSSQITQRRPTATNIEIISFNRQPFDSQIITEKSSLNTEIMILKPDDKTYSSKTGTPIMGAPTPNSEYIQPSTPMRQRAQHQGRGSTTRTSIGNIAAVSAGGHLGRKILFNTVRAFLVRALFIIHSITTIRAAVSVRNDPSIWTFSLVSALIAIEGAYAIVLRAGDEHKWFSPSILLYILATAPPLHLIETQICDWRKSQDVKRLDDKVYFQLLEQLLLVILIIGRWLLPKGEISREQLSQILLAYLAISSDIVEFFDVFKEEVVYRNRFVQNLVLGAWTLSLLQFPFVLTVSRARKMRVAIINEEKAQKKRMRLSQIIYDIDIWSIVLANGLQDIPFFVVRLYLITYHGLLTYTMIFFICKNALIIVLQTYRAFVLINDRYIHPKPTMHSELEQKHPNLQKRRPTGISISTASMDSEISKKQKRRIIREHQKEEFRAATIAKLSSPPLAVPQHDRRRNTIMSPLVSRTTDISPSFEKKIWNE